MQYINQTSLINIQNLCHANMGVEGVVSTTEVFKNFPSPNRAISGGMLNVCSATGCKKSLKQTLKHLGEGNTISRHFCSVTLSGLRNGLFGFQVLLY